MGYFYVTTTLRPMIGCRGVHTLRTAVSYCAKGPFSNLNRSFGEDAAILRTWITPGAYQGASLVGVADGVGGWRRHGVDPSHLSQGLLLEMGKLFKQQQKKVNKGTLTDSGTLPGCQSLLSRAFAKLDAEGSRYAGGTTVCTGQFNPQTAEIEVLNLGDSGAWLFRGDKIIKKTVPDVHGMTPRQLTILPDWMSPDQISVDLAPEAQTSNNQIHTWKLEPQDVLVFATDGFFDNVFAEESIEVVSQIRSHTPNQQLRPQEVSDKLIRCAYRNSLNPDIATPFALRCLKEDEQQFEYWGGKPDDITLVVCVVCESELDFPAKL